MNNSFSKSGCLRSRIISDETTLLSPTHNITAFYDSTSIPSYPVKNISKALWCTNIGIGNYVNLTFSQPVIIEGILSSGGTSNNSQVHHYVSDFTILYSKTVNGPLQLYSTEAVSNNAYTTIIITYCNRDCNVEHHIADTTTSKKPSFIHTYCRELVVCFFIVITSYELAFS